MKKLLITLIAIATTIGASYAMSYDEAKKQDKPIVIMFQMHGCSACKQLSPVFDKFSSKFSDKFNFVKEDAQASKIASSFSFDSVPSFFIVKPNKNGSKKISYECASNNACFEKALSDYK